ncbi:gluconolactonase [Primorskyibacter flagellatus]|uniref:Gluconolactonase n=1 Tax=Primorskyibacter flagellatus TaxID=1387277 RepID=A0A917E8Y1_9RHOB|nr:SMP-30/gluconolactonase/LRE family protein [Primorskyibacter flagellatus]GGE15679.1 gluconolactonase [Primorskyibacter flagellatus]
MTPGARPYDDRRCELGEGPLWHPERGQLFWFDILGRRLLSRVGDVPLEWRFDEYHSAAGWIDRDTLLIASETGLWRFDVETGQREPVAALEADDPTTRSNDGRADPYGGFWIGTMGKKAEAGRGAIYRFYRGELRRLFSGMTIPNSICFATDGTSAYYADTRGGRIMRQPLGKDGWPDGAPVLFADPGAEGFHPDGSVVDSAGALWNAQWGAGRVVRYLADGTVDRVVAFDAAQTSCPAFGGPEMQTLFVTSAWEGIAHPDQWQGRVFQADAGVRGMAERAVRF